ncbi:MAG: nickel ABC transporter permease [Thermodesulfobacteriota bacterium]|nr:nickel ABC transporter permease [Thermodesulfobacteriota bacterium]
MKAFIIKRMLLFFPVVFGVLTLVFLLIHLIPGDPVDLMLGENALAIDKEKLRESLRLNETLAVQYMLFIKGVIKGDLGESLHNKEPVIHMILKRYPETIKLTIAAMTLALLISLPIGIYSAVKQYSFMDNCSMFFALLGVSMPNFWLGPLLMILFCVNLGWFPISGDEGLRSIVLPAVTLGTAMSAILSRMVRSSMLEVINEEYIVTARAKGLSELRVIFRHALKNALVPIITVIGLQFGALLAGAIITETIFSWPGIGRLLIQAINTRDYPLVQGCVLAISISYVLINIITDIAYSYIDPRIKLN